MQLGVCALQVAQLNGLAQQLLVKRLREAAVDVVAVKHRQAHYTTHKVEIREVVLRHGGGGHTHRHRGH